MSNFNLHVTHASCVIFSTSDFLSGILWTSVRFTEYWPGFVCIAYFAKASKVVCIQ